MVTCVAPAAARRPRRSVRPCLRRSRSGPHRATRAARLRRRWPFAPVARGHHRRRPTPWISRVLASESLSSRAVYRGDAAPGGLMVRSMMTLSPFLTCRSASGAIRVSKESRAVLIFTLPSRSTSVIVP